MFHVGVQSQRRGDSLHSLLAIRCHGAIGSRMGRDSIRTEVQLCQSHRRLNGTSTVNLVCPTAEGGITKLTRRFLHQSSTKLVRYWNIDVSPTIGRQKFAYHLSTVLGHMGDICNEYCVLTDLFLRAYSDAFATESSVAECAVRIGSKDNMRRTTTRGCESYTIGSVAVHVSTGWTEADIRERRQKIGRCTTHSKHPWVGMGRVVRPQIRNCPRMKSLASHPLVRESVYRHYVLGIGTKCKTVVQKRV